MHRSYLCHDLILIRSIVAEVQGVLLTLFVATQALSLGVTL